MEPQDPHPYRQRMGKWIAFVVIVLATVAVILVWLIWPKAAAPQPSSTAENSAADLRALQLTEQNTTRKTDVTAIAAGATEFVSNHNGSLPTTTGGTSEDLLLCAQDCGTASDTSKVKLGVYKAENVNFQGWYAQLKVPDADTVYLVMGGECKTDETGLSPTIASSNRRMAILYALDVDGESTEQHCSDL